MNTWTDFNDAEQQQGFDLIPKGTTVKVRMTIKPGGHDDPAQGWTGGYATESFDTGSVYLACEFVVLEGAYARGSLRPPQDVVEHWPALLQRPDLGPDGAQHDPGHPQFRP